MGQKRQSTFKIVLIWHLANFKLSDANSIVQSMDHQQSILRCVAVLHGMKQWHSLCSETWVWDTSVKSQNWNNFQLHNKPWTQDKHGHCALMSSTDHWQSILKSVAVLHGLLDQCSRFFRDWSLCCHLELKVDFFRHDIAFRDTSSCPLMSWTTTHKASSGLCQVFRRTLQPNLADFVPLLWAEISVLALKLFQKHRAVKNFASSDHTYDQQESPKHFQVSHKFLEQPSLQSSGSWGPSNLPDFQSPLVKLFLFFQQKWSLMWPKLLASQLENLEIASVQICITQTIEDQAICQTFNPFLWSCF